MEKKEPSFSAWLMSLEATHRGEEPLIDVLRGALTESSCCLENPACYVCSDCERILKNKFVNSLHENYREGQRGAVMNEAMFTAAGQSHYTIMKLLGPYCNINHKVSCYTTNRLRSSVYLGYNPLQVTVVRGDVEGINLLLNAGADINILDRHGSSLLHLAAQNVKSCNLENGLAVMDLMIARGLSPNQQNAMGNSPLHQFTLVHFDPLCKQAVTEKLVRKSCEIDMLNNSFFTALHLAVRKMDMEMMSVLLKHGANIHVGEDLYGSPVNVAREFASALFTAHGGSVDLLSPMLMLMSAGGMPTSSIHLLESPGNSNAKRKHYPMCNKQFLRILLLWENKPVLFKMKELCYPFKEERKFVHDLYQEESINVMTEEELHNLLDVPSSLQDLSAMVIRTHLYPNAWVAVDKLQLPGVLKAIVNDPKGQVIKQLSDYFYRGQYEFCVNVLCRRLSSEEL